MSEDLKERVHKCRMKHMVNGTAYLVGDLRREIAALRAENERLKEATEAMRAKCEAIARTWANLAHWHHAIRMAEQIADEIAALKSGEIRAAIPTETGTPLEKHGISEE